MKLCHSPAATAAVFNDPNLVSAAGLVPVMALAEKAGAAPVGGCLANRADRQGCQRRVEGVLAGRWHGRRGGQCLVGTRSDRVQPDSGHRDDRQFTTGPGKQISPRYSPVSPIHPERLAPLTTRPQRPNQRNPTENPANQAGRSDTTKSAEHKQEIKNTKLNDHRDPIGASRLKNLHPGDTKVARYALQSTSVARGARSSPDLQVGLRGLSSTW